MTQPKAFFAGDLMTMQTVEASDSELLNVRQQSAIMLDILCHFLTQDTVSQLGAWCDHVGFDISALRHT